MRSFVAAFLVAALVGSILTPLVSRLALRLGAVSKPGGRNVNATVIPRLGGIAIALAFFTPLLLLFFFESVVAESFTGDAKSNRSPRGTAILHFELSRAGIAGGG